MSLQHAVIKSFKERINEDLFIILVRHRGMLSVGSITADNVKGVLNILCI